MQGNDSYRLVVRRGPAPNTVFDLTKDSIRIGRDITNDITINDPEVSRHHLTLVRGAGGYTVEDNRSTNGSFINGVRVTTPRPLRPGEMLGMGETVTLLYEVIPAGAGAVTMPGAEFGGTVPSSSAGAGAGYGAPAQPSPYNQPSPSPYAPQGQPAQPPGPAAPASGFQPPIGGQPGAQPSPQPSPYAPQGGPGSYGGGNPYNPQPVPASNPYGEQQNATYAGQNAGLGGYAQSGSASAYGVPANAGVPQAPGAAGTGYGDYDPYAVREEESRNTTRWILIGCAGVSLFCCCGTIIGAVIVDSLCLWNSIPVVNSIVRALGYVTTC